MEVESFANHSQHVDVVLKTFQNELDFFFTLSGVFQSVDVSNILVLFSHFNKVGIDLESLDFLLNLI